MSKAIEFKVQITNTVIGGVKEKVFYAKSYEKLLKSMPKEVKRKWKTINYSKEGVDILVHKDNRLTLK